MKRFFALLWESPAGGIFWFLLNLSCVLFLDIPPLWQGFNLTIGILCLVAAIVRLAEGQGFWETD